MAAMISRRFSYRLLTSSPSSSLYSQPRPSNTIAKPTPEFHPSGTPKSLHLCHGSTPSCTESNINSFSLSSDENPRNVWSSHTFTSSKVSQNASPNHERLFVQKPKILDPSFVTPAPIVTSRSPSSSLVTKARFFSANGSSSKSENPELPHPSQIPDSRSHPSYFADETRELLKKSMKNFNGLKNAVAVVSVAHIGLGAWVAYISPFSPIALIQSFLACAIPLWLVINMRPLLQLMHSFKMEKEEVWFMIFRQVCLVICQLVVQSGLGLWIVIIIRPTAPVSPEVYVQAMSAIVFPGLIYNQQLRILWAMSTQERRQLLDTSTWIERHEVLKILNLHFVRFRRASLCAAAGISAILILELVLRNPDSIIFIDI